VIAEIQKITYEEFLHALIGDVIPPYVGYKPEVNPSIFNEFSAAAFRLGHSMLSPQILRLDREGSTIPAGNLELRNAFFSAPSILRNGEDLEPILRGLARQSHQAIDVKVVSDLRNFLFGQPGSGGLDLASLNIQRGRDHGVSPCNDTREAMGLGQAQDFNEISSDESIQEALRVTYGSVDDAAGRGSQIGRLFRNILGIQFTALRDGDRFWHERDLSEQEISLVEGVTLARVIRGNTAIGNEIQDNVFRVN